MEAFQVLTPETSEMLKEVLSVSNPMVVGDNSTRFTVHLMPLCFMKTL